MGTFTKRCKECGTILSQREYGGPDKDKTTGYCFKCKNKTGPIHDGGLTVPKLIGMGQ